MKALSPQLVLAAVMISLAACSTTPKISETDSAPTGPVDVSGIPDAKVRHEPRSAYGNPPNYEVFGKRYYVMETSKGFSETGTASWYGTKFHGKRTSSGEPYDMYAMTAAHKTLPLPTYVRVTNLENQRQIVVKVNDRGPFVGDRIIDLSYTAAIKLDMTTRGTARVFIETLLPNDPALEGAELPPPVTREEPPAIVASGEAAIFIQVGAFGAAENAARQELILQELGFPTVVRITGEGETNIYRVRVGPLADQAAFDSAMARLQELDYTDIHMALE